MNRLSRSEGRTQLRSRAVLYVTAALSLVAALVHLWVMPEHFEEWWGYGAFFLVSAIFQGAYAPALMRWPRPWVFDLGILGRDATQYGRHAHRREKRTAGHLQRQS
jgi:hypothetical protein